jgi:hypothetical protein
VFADSDTVSITGIGTSGDTWIATVIPDPVGGLENTVDGVAILLDPAGCASLSGAGLLVPCISVLDSDTIDFSLPGGAVSGDVILDPDAANILTSSPFGVLADIITLDNASVIWAGEGNIASPLQATAIGIVGAVDSCGLPGTVFEVPPTVSVFPTSPFPPGVTLLAAYTTIVLTNTDACDRWYTFTADIEMNIAPVVVGLFRAQVTHHLESNRDEFGTLIAPTAISKVGYVYDGIPTTCGGSSGQRQRHRDVVKMRLAAGDSVTLNPRYELDNSCNLLSFVGVSRYYVTSGRY